MDDSSITPSVPLLEIYQLSKSFGTVHALQSISFTVERGEIVALVGDNGAGKSTLVKILSGFFPPTSGEFRLNGVFQRFTSPADARAAGIETVYQNLALIDHLDVADNVYLGRETTRGGFIGKLLGILDRPRMRDSLRDLHVKIPDPKLPVRLMSGGQRQAVALGRAITWAKHLVILDEPTAALGVEETERVLQLVETLRTDHKLSFLMVSHNMEHIYRIADKIIILRQGQHVITLNKRDTSPQEIISYITLGGIVGWRP